MLSLKIKLHRQNLKYYLLGLYLFHFFATQVMLPALHTHSLYPFYNWDLFSYMPRYFYGWYFIKLTSIDGQPLETPLIYSFHRDKIKPKTKWLLHDQIFILGRAVESQTDKLTFARHQLEKNLFKNLKSAEYEVLKGNIDIRSVRKTQKIDKPKVLGRFSYQKEPSS